MKIGLLIIAFVVVLSGCIGSNRADNAAPKFSSLSSAVGSNKSAHESPATNASGNVESEGVIRAGDILLITFTIPSAAIIPAWDQRVKDDGTITLIYNKMFQASGKGTLDLEKEIRDYYVPAYFTNLTVMVRIALDTGFVYVDGEFRNPGRYTWTNGMRLKDAFEAAGGFTEFGNHKVRLRHLDGTIEKFRLRGNWSLTNNPSLKPGDRITNPRDLL